MTINTFIKNFFLTGMYCLFAVLFFSCTAIEPITIGGIENVSVKQLSRKGLEADLGVRIKNPNNISVTVYPSDFDATLNGMEAGKLKLAKSVNINANSDDIFYFHIQADFSKLDLTSLISLLATKQADVVLKGNIKAGKWHYRKIFPVEFKKTISLGK